jgi:hypothetical protein
MKYAIIREDGATEIREDSYPLQANAIALTDEQHTQLISGKYLLQDGQVVVNPNSKD